MLIFEFIIFDLNLENLFKLKLKNNMIGIENKLKVPENKKDDNTKKKVKPEIRFCCKKRFFLFEKKEILFKKNIFKIPPISNTLLDKIINIKKNKISSNITKYFFGMLTI